MCRPIVTETMKRIGRLNYWFVLIMFVTTADSARVLPRPILSIDEVTPYSITLIWTMPPNELYDEFVVEMIPEEGNVEDYSLRDMRRKFTDLTPGTLYTFTVRMVRGESFSEPATIRQDTRPLIPNGLTLRTFDTLVLTMESPYFGDTEFTVETHGVEASWDSPNDGVSECYHTEISDEDGLTATPGEDGEVARGAELRQFINLTPGRTYTVTVYATTCGQGHLGELRSDGISKDIFLPPSAPPEVLFEEETNSVELTWGTPEGEYDDFEIVTESTIIVGEETDRTRLGRNISGLTPCTEYEFEIYSLLDGVRSESPASVTVLTKPLNDVIVSVSSFTHTSITFSLRSPSGADAQYELRLNPSGRIVRTDGSSVTFDGLTPGLKYSVTTTTSCPQNEEVKSTTTTTIEQTTKPALPEITAACSYVGLNDSHSPLYESVPWNPAEYSRVTLSWPLPTTGLWENFVVDYSPHVFEEGPAYPKGPLVLPADATSATVNIPAIGRVISVSVRTRSNNVLSEPVIVPAYCGDRNGESVLRCRSFVQYWKIIITPIEDNQLRITIPDFSIHNATIHVRRAVSVYTTNEFVIANPCESDMNAKIIVYPRCPDSLPHCPTIIRPLCPRRVDGRRVEGTACCHNKLYSTDNQICCHNRLLKKSDRESEECCLTRWYDSKSQKCCRNGNTPASDEEC